MHAQLQAVVQELEQAHERLRALARTVPEEWWPRRPGPDRWSVAECVAHVNLTSAAFAPLLREGIARARLIDGPPPTRYRRDPIGWLLWRTMGPPVRFRVKTTAPFIPMSADAPGRLVEDFDRLQRAQIACVTEANGLPLGRVTIASPFNARLKYNLYSCFSLLPRHQHRHLWQAERAWQALQTEPANGLL